MRGMESIFKFGLMVVPMAVSVTSFYIPMTTTIPSAALNCHSRPRQRFRTTTHESLRVDTRSFALSAIDTSMIDNFFQSQPYVSAFLTCGFKATAADVLAQVREEGGSSTTSDDTSTEESDEALSLVATFALDDDVSETGAVSQESTSSELDWQRTYAFLFYGGIYQGLFQEFLYAGLFPSWFPSNDWQSVVSQVALDMSFFTVFLCLPVAYVVKTAFMTDGASLFSLDTAKIAIGKYRRDVQERGLLFKYWAIWIPVQTLNFSVVPTHLRVAFVAVVSFFWMFVLSTTSAQGDSDESEGSLAPQP
jgi:Mpv17 / PMP22 family